MSKQIEFTTKDSANGAAGIYIHVRRDDPEFIDALHTAAVIAKRPELVKQLERYAAGRVEFTTKAELAEAVAEPMVEPEPEVEEVAEPPKRSHHRKEHK